MNALYSRRDLERVVHMRGEHKPLATIPIPDYYLRQGEQRKLRPYQQDAIKALDIAIELESVDSSSNCHRYGKDGFNLPSLETPYSGGTRRANSFLVDREQLAKQALEAIQDILEQYGSYWLRPGIHRQKSRLRYACSRP